MNVLGKAKAPVRFRKSPSRGRFMIADRDGSEPITDRNDEAPIATEQVREHVGFDRERAAYGHAKPGLLRSAEGLFVVFVGEEMIGPFPSFRDAMREGFEKFGLGPLYIKKVREVEPTIDLGPFF